jgi:chromate transporter
MQASRSIWAEAVHDASDRSPSLLQLTTYFLKLGASGFGGPAALAERMRRDLVEARGWLTLADFDLGLSLAAACPGPLAYQLAVYCGFACFGTVGALAVAVAFAAAPFAIVLAISTAYVRWSGVPLLDAIFYGVSPAVIALIVRACWNLGRKTLKRDLVSWALAAVAGGVTMATGQELFAVILAAGLVGIVAFRGPTLRRVASEAAERRVSAALPIFAVSASATTASSLFAFFFKTGCAVFGSGLVIVPFLRAYVVHDYGWLSDRQFRDAVAIGLMSPGPVVITATFVGFIVDGVTGAAAATIGMFAPAVLFTLVATPIFRRHGASQVVRGFVRGVTSAVVGVLAGTVPLVASTAIVDVLTAAIGISAILLLSWRRLPEPLVIAGGAIVGLVVR